MSNNGWSNQTNTRVVIVEGTPYSGLFFYAPEPGPGNLVGSWTVDAGIDPYLNSYPAGLEIGSLLGSAGVVIAVGPDGKTGFIYFPGIVANVLNDAHIQLNQQGLAPGQFSFLTIASAEDATQQDIIAANLAASSQDGTQLPTLTIAYQQPPPGNLVFNMLSASLAGCSITGAVTAVRPGTGTARATPALPETWHAAALTADFTTNAGDQAPRYQLEGVNAGRGRLDGVVYSVGVSPSGTTMFTVPAALVPKFRKRFETVTNGAAAVGGSTLLIQPVTAVNPGDVVLEVAMTAGQQLVLDGVTWPVD